MTPGIFISAGEASGEAYGALLIEELRRQMAAQNREAHFWGMGGPRMVAAGLDCVVRAEDMAVMGITEVVRHLPRIYREFRRLKQAIRDRRPSVAVLIDFPDIHFKLAEELHRLGIPVIFFVSPQLWAWKKHRIKLVQKYVDRMLVIFPFEEPFYRGQGVNAEFVGHPLAELPLPTISREEFATHNNLDPAKTWIGLLPGSRAKEIRDNLPEMLAAADHLYASNAAPIGLPSSPEVSKGHGFSRADFVPKDSGALAPEGCLQFLLPLAPTLTDEKRAWVHQFVQNRAIGLPVTLVDDARAALFHARASIVASGTATVEAALIGNPFVVVYRVSPLTYAIAKRVVSVPHVAMVNLIAQKRVIPELIQNDFTASNIVREITPLLPDGTPRQSMMKELADLRGVLQARSNARSVDPTAGGAIARVAKITLELLGNSGQSFTGIAAGS
jgi:lipid-A-disaccharide synthase